MKDPITFFQAPLPPLRGICGCACHLQAQPFVTSVMCFSYCRGVRSSMTTGSYPQRDERNGFGLVVVSCRGGSLVHMHIQGCLRASRLLNLAGCISLQLFLCLAQSGTYRVMSFRSITRQANSIGCKVKVWCIVCRLCPFLKFKQACSPQKKEFLQMVS